MLGIEEEANLIYLALATEKYAGNSDDISMSDIVKPLREKYDIRQVTTSGNAITGISLESGSISLSKNDTTEIEVTYEGGSDGNLYYAVINDKYYKMSLTNSGLKIDNTASEIDETPTTDTLTATSDNDCVEVSVNDDKIILTGGDSVGTAKITVSYGEYSVTCSVSVVAKPTEDSEADSTTSFSTAYGRIDVIWLDGTSNTVTTTPNAPVLTSNGESMTPVSWTYDSTAGTWSEDETTQNTWYNYKAGTGTEDNLTSMWANAKTANGSYFVWIPRYAYRITYYESQTSTTPTGHYDGFGMWNATDGTVKYALESGVETVDYNGEKYIVHPAFETNLDLGGWSSDLSGFWFAKFEMSGTGTTLASTYGTASIRDKTGTQYTSARQATYGYTGTTDFDDGNTSYMNSHMVKNSEWGAVAYLTHSQYGRNGNEITINSSSSYYRGGGSGTAYLTNTNQSTTGNAYGVYDMSGGADEHIASWDAASSSSNISSYGSSFASTNGTSTKYATAYNNGTATDYGTLIYTVGKVGDATKEVYTGSSYQNWFSEYSYFVYFSKPFFTRGGSYNIGSNAGVFCSYSYSGVAYGYYSFRVALCF